MSATTLRFLWHLIQESLDRSKQGCWAGEIQAEAGVQVEAGVQAEAGVQTVAQGQDGAQVDEWAESLVKSEHLCGDLNLDVFAPPLGFLSASSSTWEMAPPPNPGFSSPVGGLRVTGGARG